MESECMPWKTLLGNKITLHFSPEGMEGVKMASCKNDTNCEWRSPPQSWGNSVNFMGSIGSSDSCAIYLWHWTRAII